MYCSIRDAVAIRPTLDRWFGGPFDATTVPKVSRLSGLVVLVGPLDSVASRSGLGSSTVIGAVVSRLVAEGARVAVGGGSEKFSAPQAGDVVPGNNVAAVDLDPADTSTWRAAVDGAVAAFGRLDAVVARADSMDSSGHGLAQYLTDLSLDHLASTGGGALVSLVSDTTEPSSTSAPPELLAAAGRRGVRVNSIRLAEGDPGGKTTGVLFDGDQPRSVTPGDVASLVAFLLSDDSATCTGSVIPLDAGSSAVGDVSA